MEMLKTVLAFIPVVLSATLAIISFVYAIKARRAAKKHLADATTAEEQAQADADLAAAELALETAAKSFIADAEVMYKSFDDVLKAKGQSAGTIKKETVLSKLRTYAIEKGITLDVDAWSAKIDELVAFTKKVNSK